MVNRRVVAAASTHRKKFSDKGFWIGGCIAGTLLLGGCTPERPSLGVTAPPGNTIQAGEASSAIGGTVLTDGQVRLSPPVQSALVLVLDGGQLSRSRAVATDLLSATSRRQEHLLVLCGGKVLLTSVSPSGTDVVEPITATAPSGLPAQTDVQRVRKKEAQQRYQEATLAANDEAVRHGEQELARWRQSVSTTVRSASCTSRGAKTLDQALGKVEEFFNALNAVQENVAARREVLLLGLTGVPVSPLPSVFGHDLDSTTVIVTPFTGDVAQAANWEEAFLSSGARRAVLLPAGAEPELSGVAISGLSGSITQYAADLLFPLGSASLDSHAVAALMAVLDDLGAIPNGRYEVLLHGFADSLASPQGNEELSLERTEAVQAWLVDHGVAINKIRSQGHGDASPVASEGSFGQPKNRHVVVIVQPTA